jgi:hypothetical protein
MSSSRRASNSGATVKKRPELLARLDGSSPAPVPLALDTDPPAGSIHCLSLHFLAKGEVLIGVKCKSPFGAVEAW